MSLLKVTPGFLFFFKKKKSQNIVFIFTIRPLGVKQNKNKTDSKCRQGDRICFSSLTARSRGEAVAQEPLWPECVTACAWYGESAGPAMINCNLTTILYLYCLPLTRTCARTDAHKHTRARAHTRAHTLARSWTFLSPLSVPDIYPTKQLHPCHVSNFRDDIKNLKNKKKATERRGTPATAAEECREEIFDCPQPLRALCYHHYFSWPARIHSRLLCCSVAARGASCFGHTKSISRSQRGAPSRVFIGAGVTKTRL